MHTDVETAWAILGLALVLDCVLGEYPSFMHPVVWMGRLISACLRLAPTESRLPKSPGLRKSAFFFGASVTLLTVGISAASAWLLLWLASWSRGVGDEATGFSLIEVIMGAFLLKASFAMRELGRAALRVVKPLDEGNLAAARQALRSLCSRDPDELTAEELLAAAIESLAENGSDSIVAPLFFYVLLGVPGAVAYRAINTLDAMIGYRGKYEWLGKFAARLDDVANFIPARLTALLFMSVGWILGGNWRNGWRILRRDGAATPSPNGGRPMAAMAGLLDVRLDKKGVYALGDPCQPLTAAKVRQAWRIVLAASAVMAVLCALALHAQR